MSDAYLSSVLSKYCSADTEDSSYFKEVAGRLADVAEAEILRLGDASRVFVGSFPLSACPAPPSDAGLSPARAMALHIAACLLCSIGVATVSRYDYRSSGKGYFYSAVLNYLVSKATPTTAALLARSLLVSEHTPHLALCPPKGSGYQHAVGTTLEKVEGDQFLLSYARNQLEEDRIRRSFARNELDAIGPWDACVSLSSLKPSDSGLVVPPLASPLYCGSSFHRAAACVAEAGKAGDLKRMQEILASKPALVDSATFQRNWALLTNGLLDGMDWTNVVAAGGSVLACLLPGFVADDYGEEGKTFLSQLRGRVFELTYNNRVTLDPHCVCALNGFHSADIDLFFYGLDEAQAKRRVEEIVELVEQNQGRAVLMRSSQAVTIFGQNPHRDVQIVFRLYRRPCEVIHGFDVDCVAVAYDGSEVYLSRRALAAIRARTNVINMTRRSTTYGARLIKYAYRGFAIAAPGFSRCFGVPSAVPSGARASTALQAWASTGTDKHTCSAAEYRYLARLSKLREDARLARTKAGHDLTAIVSEDLVMWHTDLCLGGRVSAFAAEAYGRYGRLCAGYLYAVSHPGATADAAATAFPGGDGTAGSEKVPAVTLTELLERATRHHIGGYEARSCSCRISIDQRTRVLEFCAAVCARNRTEDRAAIHRLREERRMLAGEVRAVLGAEPMASELVEQDLQDAGLISQYRKAEVASRELDPLSIAFSYQHDYATPCSNGFHTQDALDWAEQNPRAYGSLRIGTPDFALLGPSAPRIQFLRENPGKQGLMTSSFQPLDDAGFYGDFRVLLGPQAFESSTEVAPSYGAHQLDALQEARVERQLLKVFTVNHFSSVPLYLSSVYSRGEAEATALRELSEGEDALRQTLAGDASVTAKLACLSSFSERRLSLTRTGLRACERSVAEMETFNADAIAYPHGRKIRSWTEDTLDSIRAYVAAIRSAGSPEGRVQADLCDLIISSCVRDAERHQDLQTWEERYRAAEKAHREFQGVLREMREAMLAGREFEVPRYHIHVRPTDAALYRRLYAELAGLNCELIFSFCDAAGAQLPLSALDTGSDDTEGWRDAMGSVSLASGPSSAQEASFKARLDLSSSEAQDGVAKFVDLCKRMLDRKTTIYVLPDFSAAVSSFSISDAPLGTVLEASASPDEPLFLLWRSLEAVLSRGVRFAPEGSNAFVGERGRLSFASFQQPSALSQDSTLRAALRVCLSCEGSEKARRLESAGEVAKLFSPVFCRILGEDAELTQALRAELTDATDSTGIESVIRAIPSLRAVPYEELRIPRCAVFNAISRAVQETRSKLSEPCVVPGGPDKARKFLSAFSLPCKSAAELGRRRLSFVVREGDLEKALPDGEFGRLLLEALQAEKLVDEELNPIAGPLSDYAVDVWTRLGRLLSWSFLQGRKLGLPFPPYVYKAILRGSNYVYTPEDATEALFDCPPSSEVHRMMLELLSMRDLSEAQPPSRYRFRSVESGVIYQLGRLGEGAEEGESVEGADEPGFCVYIADPRSFASHYATEMLFVRRSAALGCLCRGWEEAGIEQVILSRTGFAGLSFLNAQQFRCLFLRGGEAAPSMAALRRCFLCTEEDQLAIDAFLAGLTGRQLHLLGAVLEAQPGAKVRVRKAPNLEEASLAAGELLLPAECGELGAQLRLVFGLGEKGNTRV